MERPEAQPIRSAHPHAVKLGPHDHRIDGLPAIMNLAARPRGQAHSVDPRAAFRQVGDPAINMIEDAVDDYVEIDGDPLVVARDARRGAGPAATLPDHGKY